MKHNFKAVLEEKKKLVWPEIKKYLDNPLPPSAHSNIPAKYKKEVKEHWNMVKDYPQRQGKYVRPALLILTAEAMGLAQEKAIKLAAAMQTSEDWMLIHDDYEDNSLERRGKPALHRIYTPELAVNAGDALHFITWKIAKDTKDILGAEKAFQIIDEFYTFLTRTAIGQSIEIKWNQEKSWNLQDEDYLFIVDGKTVSYTIAGPMRLGAIAAGTNKKQLEALYRFAKPLGRCFQIRDDLLDITSTFGGLKDQKGNDIYEGKITLMLLHLFRNIKNKERKKLQSIMNKPREEKEPEEVTWVIEQMKKYGSLEYARTMGEEFAKEARTIFQTELAFLSQQPARDQLKAGIDFILERDH